MKGKIINDPIYGFLNFRNRILFEIIEHPYFQRLRNIRQMGMAHFVYPGAVHTRFQHSLGAAHLMQLALQNLAGKGHTVSIATHTAAQAAILMHDIGHGPFSHALEQCIITDMHHEDLSLLMMKKIHEDTEGKLEETIQIFTGKHPVPFLSQLVSGQMDMDRMDYLNRDSFFTGVSEGVIGYDRILQMMEVINGRLVIEEKGIHSIEKFLIARRIMYWQVYLHKTVLATEHLLVNIMKRAKQLAHQNVELFATPAFRFFLYENVSKEDFYLHPEPLQSFAALDDNDISAAIKVWQNHPDPILSQLCAMLVNRKLFKVVFGNEKLEEQYFDMKSKLKNHFSHPEALEYFLLFGKTENHTYNANDPILVAFKDGTLKDISKIDHPILTPELLKPVEKSFIAMLPEFYPYFSK